MNDDDGVFGPVIVMDARKVTPDGITPVQESIAAEIPLTITANGIELATLLASPSDLRELAVGFLFTSGFITGVDDVHDFSCDMQRWVARVTIAHTPDPLLTGKRLFTSGCGKCAMYTTVGELTMRHPLVSDFRIGRERIFEIARRLEEGTPAFRETGALHTALLLWDGGEIVMDDVARHNAVDKVVGRALMRGVDFSGCVLARTGRTSSEIVFKVRRCGIPVTVARGAPTHQAVLLARETGITLVGFSRGKSFNVYACADRIG